MVEVRTLCFVLLRIGFSEMPDLNLKVTPVLGENKYSYSLIHDFLEARIRDEIKVSSSVAERRVSIRSSRLLSASTSSSSYGRSTTPILPRLGQGCYVRAARSLSM